MEKQKNTQYLLNSGYYIPKLILGTANTETVEESVYNAIKIGYRAIDTATMYLNEEKIGKAIQRAINDNIVKRDELFIITKLRSEDKGQVQKAIQQSLELLQLDYIDLYLIHWPGGYFDSENNYINIPTYKVWFELEQLVQKKLVNSIGVCNFNTQSIVDLMSYANIKPAVNQVELHPYFQQKELQHTCNIFNIKIQCYSSLARGGKREKDGKIINVLEEDTITNLQKKYNSTSSQIILSWHYSNNLNPIARSENYDRLQENLKSYLIQLENNDIMEINNLDCNCRMVLSKQKYGLDYFD